MTRPLLTLVQEALSERSRAAAADPLLRKFQEWLDGGPRSLLVAEPRSGMWSYQDAAIAGLDLAMGGTDRRFGEGMAWLAGRTYFLPNRTPGLEADPLAVLALALGARSTTAEHRAWISRFAETAMDREVDASRRSMFGAARAVATGLGWEHVAPELVVVLESRGLSDSTAEIRAAALDAVLQGWQEARDEQAVVSHAALAVLLKAESKLDLRHPRVDDVVSLLRSVPAALKRWPWESAPRTKNSPAQRWDLPSEYHVQSLLWTVLRPVFPDLKDEEYLRSLGYTHPRVDLCIPSLRTIVEVKFLRESTQGARAKVEEEISADTGFYLSRDTGFDRIVAFVWDHVAAAQHYATLEAGLVGLRGVVGAVVVGRPGDWKP